MQAFQIKFVVNFPFHFYLEHKTIYEYVKVDKRRVETIEKGFMLILYKPLDNGFQLTLSKDITEEMNKQETQYESKLRLNTKIIVRPSGKSVVFTNGRVEQIVY